MKHYELSDSTVTDETAPEDVTLENSTTQVRQSSAGSDSPTIPGLSSGRQRESAESRSESSTALPRSTEASSGQPSHPPSLEDIQKDPIHAVQQAMVALGGATNVAQGTLVFLAAVAPRAGETLYLKVMGPSSSSKSFTTRQALSLIPSDLILMSQQVTAAYLAHTGSFAGLTVVLDEANPDHDVRQVLRLLVSEGEAKRNLVIGGKPTSLYVRGPISLVELHLEDTLFDNQDSSRALTIAVNTGAKAVEGHLTNLIQNHCVGSHERRSKLEALRSVFRDFYASLDPEIGVEIPRALLEKIVVHSDRPAILRFHVNLIGLLKATAFLRQHAKRKRPTDDREFVLVDATDYEAVFSLLQRANPQDDREELTARAAEAFTLIRPKLGGEFLDVYEISKETGLSVPQARRRLAELIEAGLMEVTKRGPKNKQLFGLSSLGERSTWKSLYGLLPDPKKLYGA